MKLPLTLRVIFHIIGLGCVGITAWFSAQLHLIVLFNGPTLLASEPNISMLFYDITVSVIAIVYVLWLIVDRVILLHMIPREVRKEMKLEA